MRLLIDECCSTALALVLERAGFDVKTVRALRPGATDVEVMALALEDDRLAVTHDYDLPELAVLHKTATLGVILVSYQAAITPEDLARVAETLAAHTEEMRGQVTIIDRKRVRTRPL